MNLRVTKNLEEANLITHSGTFHPDDVFSTMFLAKFLGDGIVLRTSDTGVSSDKAIIYDIGFGKFDHHGVDAVWRNEKFKYCSFGLLWSHYGMDYLNTYESDCLDNEKLYKVIEEKLVMQIDAIDNGCFPKVDAPYKLMDLDKIIDSFNNTWEEDIDNDEYFLEAVNFAEIIFNKLVRREKAKVKAYIEVSKLIGTEKDGILVLDKYMPYESAVLDANLAKKCDIKVVILPSNRGGYNIKPMIKDADSRELLVNFNKNYWGLHDEELERVSGIKGVRFVHLNGFLASCDNLEGALELAHQAISGDKFE